MMADTTGWNSAGLASLDSRFFVDDGLWRKAPPLTGQTKFEPLPDVRNILVTGGEGFIASWLVRHLVLKYSGSYNVISFDKLDYCSSLNNARMLEHLPNFKFFHGELTNDADCLKVLQMYNIDTVFHLAAQSHVDLSFGNSKNFTKNNVLGTHCLVESVIAVKTVKRFYHISTDEVYGEVEKEAADLLEHSLLEPTNPYAATKAAAEMIVKGYVHSFKLPAVVVRLNNVYGPHQYPEKVIPKFINLLQRHKPLCIHGDGLHTRRFLYAGDAADAFDTILHRGEIGQTYNVDSRDEISNLDLAARLLTAFGVPNDEKSIVHTRDRPFNDRRYAVNGTKLRNLGWKQQTTLEDGLKATLDWYNEFSNWWGPIENILTPFPEVKGQEIVHESISKFALEAEPAGLGAERVALNGDHNGTKLNGIAMSVDSNGVGKKRKADAMDRELVGWAGQSV